MNPQIPQKYGGAGLNNIETALVIEALSYGCTGIQLAIMGPSLAAAPVLIAGSDEQKKKVLGIVGERAGDCCVLRHRTGHRIRR